MAWAAASVCGRRRTLRSGSDSLRAPLRPPLHIPAADHRPKPHSTSTFWQITRNGELNLLVPHRREQPSSSTDHFPARKSKTRPSIRSFSSKATNTEHQPISGRGPAVTNARFASLQRAAGRPRPPLDHARSTAQLVRSSRAAFVWGNRIRGGFRLRLGGGVALRLHSAIRSIPASATLSCSPTADRSQASSSTLARQAPQWPSAPTIRVLGRFQPPVPTLQATRSAIRG